METLVKDDWLKCKDCGSTRIREVHEDIKDPETGYSEQIDTFYCCDCGHEVFPE